MSKVKMTVKEIKDLGLWDKVCKDTNMNPWVLNEGLVDYDTKIEFDTEFKNKDVDEDIIGCLVEQWDYLDDIRKNANKLHSLMNENTGEAKKVVDLIKELNKDTAELLKILKKAELI